MHTVRNRVLLAAWLAGTTLANPASAALTSLGNGIVYDDTLNLMWLADSNYGKTSGTGLHMDPFGGMSWQDANQWAADLVFGGYSDWRLPSGLSRNGGGECAGSPCDTTELGHLFWVDFWGITGGYMNDVPNPNLALFRPINVHPGAPVEYWTSTPASGAPGRSWQYNFFAGGQYATVNSAGYQAWAVRSVPEPGAWALWAVGLAAIGGWGRRHARPVR